MGIHLIFEILGKFTPILLIQGEIVHILHYPQFPIVVENQRVFGTFFTFTFYTKVSTIYRQLLYIFAFFFHITSVFGYCASSAVPFLFSMQCALKCNVFFSKYR